MRKNIAILLLALSVLSGALFMPLAAPADDHRGEIAIGLLPEINIFRQRELSEPLAAFLISELGIEVKLKMLTCGNVIEGMRAGRSVETGREQYRPVFVLVEDAGLDLEKYADTNP